MIKNILQDAPLNHRVAYIDKYDKHLLFPLARQIKRDEINISSPLPFVGYDRWTAYELSWLNVKGKPEVAVGIFWIPCESPCIIESKSLKLYLNSYNQTVFASRDAVYDCLVRDLSEATGASVEVELYDVSIANEACVMEPRFQSLTEGIFLDNLDVTCTTYTVDPSLLTTSEKHVKNHSVYSHLLKSNCLVTGQPDWGSIFIQYTGPHISEATLLQYLVSFRNHNEFHEQCVERIFSDVMRYCHVERLLVYACYTRRGGLDINPLRATELVPHFYPAALLR